MAKETMEKFDFFLKSVEPFGWPIVIGSAILGFGLVFGAICCIIKCQGSRRKLSINPLNPLNPGGIDVANPVPQLPFSPEKEQKGLCEIPEGETPVEGAGSSGPFKLPPWAIIPKDALEVNFHSKLGSGNFGIVYSGIYKNEAVAVKTLKSDLDELLKMEILKELKVMSRVGDHKNIVKFIGAVIGDAVGSGRRGESYVVLELCPFGSLKDYLLKKKVEAEVATTIGKRQSMRHQYENVGLHVNTLCFMAHQIAEGMEHLADKHIVHGDLAARNILVFHNDVVKISDFGLSKNLYSNPAYISNRPCGLPWRWISVETQERFVFSVEADVWSYGVTLWEIFSMGAKPYPNVPDYYTDFLTDIKKHRVRLDQPELAPDDVFGSVMLKCWKLDPKRRPSFRFINEFFRIR